LITYSIAVIVSLVALIYSFVETYTSSTFDVDAFFAAGPRERDFGSSYDEPPWPAVGTWNIEAWSCQIRPIEELRIRSNIPNINPCNRTVGVGRTESLMECLADLNPLAEDR
jgi:hypothetical protein